VLPVRTTRYRRTGRHSSPHQLSLPSDAPTLVIAVPGPATPENEDVVANIAEVASGSCRGAAIKAGYLQGDTDSLTAVLDGLGRGASPVAVIVPLMAFPDARVSTAIAAATHRAPLPCVVAQPLGPHPLLSEVLHVRLAEAGLARSTRVGRISIVTAADGVIVGASGDAEAVQAAGVVAVLLASRLTIPVATAPVNDPASVKEAANQLRAARVARVALAPCVIGPEAAPGALAAVAAETGVACSAPLGGHHAIGQLVAIRYGAALEDPKLAELAR
jgi:sirohydrochlorin ferrochelatase